MKRGRESLLIVSFASGAHHPHRSAAGSMLPRLIKIHGNTNAVVSLWLMPFMSPCHIGTLQPGSLTIHEWDSLKNRSCPAFPR